MFGCIVAGRLVQTNLQAVSPGKYLFVLDNATSINHIVIFLTGERAFDVGTGASVYANTDSRESQGLPWRYLGVLTNDKPSAVFKVSNLGNDALMDDNSIPLTTIHVGISIEPMTNIQKILEENLLKPGQSLIPASTVVSVVPKPLAIAQKIGENLVNYVMSFTRTSTEMTALDPTIQVVPVKVVQDWFGNLVRRATTDPELFLRQFTC